MGADISGDRAGPLAGVRILDLSAVVSGPLCAQILGDLGADVIKVEPLTGDSTRRLGPPFKAGLTPLAAHVNRNKRSLAIDLKKPEGREIVLRLTRRADVVVENFRPGVLERLGLGYRVMSDENPGLVYVSISGFGPDGPYAERPAYDMVIQALSGFAVGQGDEGTPRLVRSLIADKSSGLTAAYAVLAALFARERSGGRGQRIDVAMLDAFAAFILPDLLNAHTFVGDDQPGPPVSPADLYRAWETSDGHVSILIIEDHHFEALCRAIERPDLLEDTRYASLLGRIMNANDLFGVLQTELKRWSTPALVERAHRFGAPLAPVHGIEGFLADPQVAANRTVFEIEDRGAGRLRLLRNPVRFGSTPASVRRPPPRLGEHAEEVLREAGYSPSEVAAFRTGGVIP